ncbi:MULTISPECIES: PKD-like family lipoprotein [Sphingobacterium]|uniref:PKD-like family lipoprotein n=1 Tax=Sphingobacterium TaxID=28453 RepID=UPI0013DB847B|nr:MULTISPECIES: PKD-like family lipoprotein [unclassified Sphingobacterium]
MKNKILYLLLTVLSVFTSCRKDLGNYEYTELDSLVISGVEESYTGYLEINLEINPELNFANGRDFIDKEYSYEWFTIVGADKKVLAQTQKLNKKLNELEPGKHELYFRVTELSTKRFWEISSELTITTRIADGWLVLNNISDTARLDMLHFNSTTKNYEYNKNILAEWSKIALKGKPKLVYFVYNYDPFTSKPTARIYVGSDQETYSIDNTNRVWTSYRNLKEEVFRPTKVGYHAQVIRGMGSSNRVYMLDSDGVVGYEYIINGYTYGPTINRLNTGVQLKVSKYIAEKYTNTNPYLLMYDTDNKRFITHEGTNRASLVPSSSLPDVLNPANVGDDLLYMESVRLSSIQFYALFQNPTTKKLRLLRATNPSSGVLRPLAFDDVESTFGIESADFYAVDPNYGYLIFAKGNKVFQYDPFNKVFKTLLDVGNRSISLIKFQRILQVFNNVRYNEFGSKLMVCTYDQANPNSSGKMEFYKINLSDTPVLNEVYEGFGKIVDVSYRQ